jgi:gliding motility-associated-like protein
MKKSLLLICLIISYTFNIYGQAHCNTCSGRGYVVDSTYSNTSLNTMNIANRIGNGNSSLGQSYVLQNVCGLNYTYFSQLTETRTQVYNFNTNGSGFPTVLAIPNIPCGGLGGIIKAFAYWSASYTEASPPTTTISITDPSNNTSTYTATLIGTGPSTCWPTTGTADYRADVTAAITGSGNYSVNLNGFQNVGYEVDGVSVIIIYASPAATYSGSISLWDGCIVNFTGRPLGPETLPGINVCAATTNTSAFGIFADCQTGTNGNINKDDFNGTNGTFANDFWNFNVINNTSLTSGQTSVVETAYTNNSSDCFAWVVSGLYWQNTTCVVCTPPTSMTVTITSGNPICGNPNGFVTANVTGGTAPYTYLWSNGGTLNTISGLTAGTYSVSIKDASGCDSTTDSVTLVTSSVLVTPTLVNVLCNGQCTGSINILASGGSPPYTYTWVPNTISGSSASNLCAGIYTVTTEDNNGCTTIDTLTITQPPALAATLTSVGALCNGGSSGKSVATASGGTPPYAYAWTSASTTDSATGLSAGTYTLVLTDANGCSISPTVTITQPAALAVSISGPQTLCAKATGTLTANPSGGTSPYTYLWSTTSTLSTATIQPDSSQTYTVTVTDANGCVMTGTFTIILGPELFVTTKGPSSMCAGRSVTLCASATGGTGGTTFTWQPGNISGPCINVSPNTTTDYTVTAYDNCGTQTTAIAPLAVNPLPDVAFSADVYQGCAPLCIQFRNKTTVKSGGLQSYEWTFGNGDTSLVNDPIYCYPKSGSYGISLTTTSDSGCSSTLSIYNMITVYSHPNAAFTLSPQPATILNPTIQFTDKTTDEYGLSYWWWYFGDNTDSVSYLENPAHTYQDTGSYCAKMVTMNIHGCTDTVTNCLVIDPVFNLYIPSAFTPNGDGKNETFKPVGQYIRAFEMYIFDRWGTELYHTLDINDGWNGTVKGGSQVSQEDTYVYKINVTDSKNKDHSFVGNVTLIK